MTDHKMVLTGTWPRVGSCQSSAGQSRHGLTVRCQCMADEPGHQVPYAYDFLARGVTWEQAKAAYDEHLRTGATLVEVPHE